MHGDGGSRRSFLKQVSAAGALVLTGAKSEAAGLLGTLQTAGKADGLILQSQQIETTTRPTTGRSTIQKPKGLTFRQWTEGQVAIQGALPGGATHFRVYLSGERTIKGSLVATITPLEYPDGTAVFDAPKGRLIYATVCGYDSSSGVEGEGLPVLLQMYEVLHVQNSQGTDYVLTCFFHEPNTAITWAVGYVSDEVVIFRSADYFSSKPERYHSFSLSNDLYPKSLYPDPQLSPGFEYYLTFYIDRHGHKYISARPLPLICRAGSAASDWQPISRDPSVHFTTPEGALLVPSWSIAEADDLIVIAEYGGDASNWAPCDPCCPTAGDPGWPHHTLLKSSDPSRQDWIAESIDGPYRHIHCYQINPYNSRVHFMSLGEARCGSQFQGKWEFGLYISLDGGKTWGQNVIPPNPNVAPEQRDVFNGPCNVTFLKDASAFVTNDSPGSMAYWWGYGRPGQGWSAISYQKSMVRDVLTFLWNYEHQYAGQPVVISKGYPITPWCSIAIRDSFEVYGCVRADANELNTPGFIFRYDGDPSKEIFTVIAIGRNYDHPFWYMSNSQSNVIPSSSKYVFSTGFGGMRIPREAS